LIKDLLDVTPEDGLVLFFGEHAAPPCRVSSLRVGRDITS
jgi:hypothetical protein